MEEKLVRLLVGGLAIVARHVDGDLGRHDAALQPLHRGEDVVRDSHRIGAGALGNGERDGGGAIEAALGIARQVRNSRLGGLCGEEDLGDVTHIDRPPVAGRDQQVADLGEPGQRLAGDEADLAVLVADGGRREGTVRRLHLPRQRLQGQAGAGEQLGVRLDADFFGLLPDQIGEADIVEAGQQPPALHARRG